MKNSNRKGPIAALAAALVWSLTLVACTSGGGGGGGGSMVCSGSTSEVIYLRAEAYLQTMPDGATVTMWGYAQDSYFGALDGVVSSPGPQLQVSPCISNLIIQLDNNLPESTSIVINGQRKPMSPVFNVNGRVRSFDAETAAGNTVPGVYEWRGLTPGTYLYQSGTSPQVQVQMGLYGAFWQNLDNRLAYAGKTYDLDLVVLYSEIDPDLHHAVATDNYGPGKLMTSTVNYYPKYFLVNGAPYDPGAGEQFNNQGGRDILFRVLNAGLKARTVMLLGNRAHVIAEDGKPYTYEQDLYSVKVEAGKTKDVVIRNATTMAIATDRAFGF